MIDLINTDNNFTDFKDIKYSCPKCYEGYLVSQADTFSDVEPACWATSLIRENPSNV